MRPYSLLMAVAPLLLLNGPAKARADLKQDPALVVSPAWLQSHLDDPDLVLLELSEGDSYQGGHLPHARPVDIMAFHEHGSAMPDPSRFTRGLEALGISNTSRVVLYGDHMSTSLLYVLLDYLGMGDRTHVLDGGKEGWKAAGQPLVTDTPTYLASHFTPHPRSDMIVDAPWLASHLSDPNLALIDSRSAGEYLGEDTGSRRPGHIPGARNLDWELTFNSTGRLLPASDLAQLLAAAGYEPGDQLVVYCTVGMRASHLYFVARYLGYGPKLYLGSMNDWASDPSRMVVRGATN